MDETLEKVLTADQRKNLRERSAQAGMGPMAPPGQIIATATQITLKPTGEQKTQLADLQKTVDAGLEKALTADQKERLKQIKADFARGGPGGGGPRGGPGGGGPPGGGGGGQGGGPPAFLFTGPPGGASVFRAYRYGPEYAGLAGKDLKPGKTVEEMQPKDQAPAKGAEKSKEAPKKSSACIRRFRWLLLGVALLLLWPGEAQRVHRARGRLCRGGLVLRRLRGRVLGDADLHHVAGAVAQADAFRLAGAAEEPIQAGGDSRPRRHGPRLDGNHARGGEAPATCTAAGARAASGRWARRCRRFRRLHGRRFRRA